MKVHFTSPGMIGHEDAPERMKPVINSPGRMQEFADTALFGTGTPMRGNYASDIRAASSAVPLHSGCVLDSMGSK